MLADYLLGCKWKRYNQRTETAGNDYISGQSISGSSISFRWYIFNHVITKGAYMKCSINYQTQKTTKLCLSRGRIL